MSTSQHARVAEATKGRSSERRSSRPVNGRRARHYYLPLRPKRGLLISVRSFRMDYSRRPSRHRQICINFQIRRWRQLILRYTDHSTAPRSTDEHANTRRLQVRLASMAALFAIGLGGSIHYGLQLNKPSSLYLPSSNVPSAPVVTQHANAAHHAKNKVVGPTLPRSTPTHLNIPSVGISSPLATVGLNPDKTIEVPSDYHEAGWYDNSPTPGQLGPAIIVGHVDNVAGLGVFWELRHVKQGDSIYITRADGKTHTFTVTEVTQFSRDNFPTSKVYGNINYAGLRLITCGGVFNTTTHEYNLNTVVFAKLTK